MRRQQRRVAEIEHIVQSTPERDDQVRVLQRIFCWRILVNVSQSAVRGTLTSKDVLVIGNDENRNATVVREVGKLALRRTPPDPAAGNDDRSFSLSEQRI